MYPTLPNNASQNIYVENTNFTVHPPKTVDFVGPWEVALVEFCNPNSWYNLSGLSDYYLYYRQNAVAATSSIPAGRDVAAAPQTSQLGGPGQLWGPKLVWNCFLAT